MKKQGFNLPNSYFEETKFRLKDIPLDGQLESETVFPQDSSGFQFNWFYASLAVAATLVISFFVFQPESTTNPDPDLNYSELKEQEIINFLIEDPSAIYPESFITLSDEDIMNQEEALDSELIDAYLSEQYFSNEYL